MGYGYEELRKVLRLIQEYGEATRAWYINQADRNRCNRAIRLEKKCSKTIDAIFNSTTREKLQHRFLKEIWSVNNLQPQR